MSDLAPQPGPDDRTRFQVDRLAFFSDAVFAIAITLLALNIRVPAITGGRPDEGALIAAVGSNYAVSRVIGFLLSFLVIGNYWRSHHRLFRWVRDHDSRLVTINLWLLLFVSFIPAPTTFYSDYPDYRTPLVCYAVSLSAVGVMNSVLWSYLRRYPELLYPGSPPFELRLGAGRSLVIPAACALAIGLSFANLWLARLSLLLIPLWTRAYTRLASRPGRLPRPSTD